MKRYSPFAKPLNQLEAGDLAALIDVHEGWYVEYKQAIPDASSIAKSVSAFANTYGGWLFYGIREKSKSEQVAGGFPGVPQDQVDIILQRMRQAVATSTNPAPHFDTKVLWGPHDGIALADGRAVVRVHVPWSTSAPHVHKNGRIYRRVADGSEPRAEHDRFFLDQLWHRSDQIKKWVERWIDRGLEFSNAESKIPYARVLMVPDLWEHHSLSCDLSLREVRHYMRGEAAHVGIPFDVVHRCATGFIGRQLIDNDPGAMTITWRLQFDFTSEAIIPLPLYEFDDPDHLIVDLDGYEHEEHFIEILKQRGFKSSRIVDVNFLFNVLRGVVDLENRLLSSAGWSGGFSFKAQILNVWRTCPFLDVRSVISEYESHGVPMSLESTIISPPGRTPEDFAEIPSYDDSPTENERLMTQATHCFLEVAPGFGLPMGLEDDTDSDVSNYYQELAEAGVRALEVQRRRRARDR